MRNWGIVLLTLLALLSPPARADCFKTCVTSPDGIATIQFFEGFNPYIYKDVAGFDTIGYGHLVLKNEVIAQPLLGQAAIDLLRYDLRRTERGLNTGLGLPLRQYRFDALSSFAFNVGVPACTGSTLFRFVNQGRFDAAAGQFPRWINAGGKPSKGLIVRRKAEQNLFVGQ